MWVTDFFHLIYPRICACCGNNLWASESVICNHCEYHLPKTWYHLEKDNPVNRIFWGRIPVEQAAAFLHFNKGNKVQTLIHQLKYSGRKDIGLFLGKRYGLLLQESPHFRGIDLIIPVPLHEKRLRRRGYNQSEQFALGLAAGWGMPVDILSLKRLMHSGTQTKKSRFQRWENVHHLFSVVRPDRITGRHILLVDDVITTGATIEACAETLLEVEGTRVSVASIAVTSC